MNALITLALFALMVAALFAVIGAACWLSNRLAAPKRIPADYYDTFAHVRTTR